MNTSHHQHDELSSSMRSESSSTSDFSSRRRSQGLRVSFGPLVTQHAIPQIDTLSKEERKSVWYSDKELRKITRRVKKIIKKKVEIDEREDCWRGLEYYVDERRTNYKPPSKEEALLVSDMRAAMDSAEAYTIYLETMDAELVNSCFQ